MNDTRKDQILTYIDKAIVADQKQPTNIEGIPGTDVQDVLNVLWDVSILWCLLLSQHSLMFIRRIF